MSIKFNVTYDNQTHHDSSEICSGLAHFPKPNVKLKKIYLKKFPKFSQTKLYLKNFLYFGKVPNLTYYQNLQAT